MDDKTLGHIWTEISLGNPRESEIEALAVKALADTGASMLCIPEHIAIQLGLDFEITREVNLADGLSKEVPYVGPIRVTFNNRCCYVGAFVLGDEVLLGSIPMEDMDLVLNPSRQEITVNPASPNIPNSRVKKYGVRKAA